MSSWLNMLFGLESLAPSRGSHVITRAGGFFSQNPPKGGRAWCCSNSCAL